MNPRPMTTHELARLLLDGPDVPVGVTAHDQFGSATSAGLAVNGQRVRKGSGITVDPIGSDPMYVRINGYMGWE